jgi:desulfoferrodoxin-like iron-binding protein
MQLYQCQFCRQMVEVWVQGAGSLSCCGSPLKLLGIGRVSPSGCQAQHDPPLDLREVVIGGKSRWEFPESRELPPENDRLADW